MRLAARGVEFVAPDPRLVSLSPDGRALTFSTDVARTAEAIRAFSEADAAKYPEFCGVLERLGAFLGELLETTPPSLDGPAAGELWELLKTGRRFRALGRTDSFRLLRWMPMAAADLVAEWFSTDLLQAAVAARGIFGVAQGPWSAGTGATLLLNAAVDPAPGGSSVTVKGGPGALTRAMADAATQAGAEIRTGASVARVLVRDGRATGVVLDDGREIGARAVISNADPKRTFLGLVDPVELDPSFLVRMRNYRCPGTAAKVNLALSALPAFRGVDQPVGSRRAASRSDPASTISSARSTRRSTGEISADPYLDVTFPTLHDPSLAPAGAHVMSIYVQFAPYSSPAGALDRRRRRARAHRHAHALAARAGHRAARRPPAGHHAARSRGDVWADRRPHPARRAVARSALHDAPGPRLGPVPHADRGTVPVRRGHASRVAASPAGPARMPRERSSRA